MHDTVKIYEDEKFYVRDDIASGITIDECRRYSVFSKEPYHRLIVYNVGADGTAEQALQLFKNDQEVLLLELSQLK